MLYLFVKCKEKHVKTKCFTIKNKKGFYKMKKTKNMIFENSCESRELKEFCANTEIFHNWIKSIIHTLHKHYKKSNFDKEKAILFFFPLTTYASKIYKNWFSYYFTVKERYTACCLLYNYYFENIVADDI